jgi:tRNA threonylcarbamoyladenosine biosynthesis protein TsaB
VASVAILDGDTILARYSVNYKKTHSQTLLPMLAEITQMTEFELNSLDAIAIAKGPGSFTGLRIGSATAKGLGLALDKPIIPVPTVDALAFNLWGTDKLVCPLMDARRQQAYTGLYTFADGKLHTVVPQCAVDISEVVAEVNKQGREVIFLGDGVPVFSDYLAEHVTVPYSFAPATCHIQRATCVATLGAILYEKGIVESARDHKPDYLRLSQAEREREERERDFKIC